MAEAVSLGVAPHNPLGPIAGAAALHFAVSTPNHVIQEEMVGAVPWYFDVVQGPIRMVDGFWQVTDAPGLGITVNEAECQKHPFAPEIIHTRNAALDDGTVVLLCHKLTGRGIVGSAIIRRARDEPSYPIRDARGAVCRLC
jgi:galactonate dehydratase